MVEHNPNSRREGPDSHEWLRLRDLISGLNSNRILADDLIERIDPDLADEVHAMTAHRGIEIAAFLAEVLTQVASDAADAAWRNVLTQRAAFDDDPEAILLAQVLRKAMRMNRNSVMLTSKQPVKDDPHFFQRIGQPYTSD